MKKLAFQLQLNIIRIILINKCCNRYNNSSTSQAMFRILALQVQGMGRVLANR